MSSKAEDGYNLETMVEDLKALIENQNFAHKRVTLVGHSYGALIALTFARLYPEAVERLVLVESPLPPGRGLEIDAFFSLSAEEQSLVLPEDLKEQLEKGGRQAKKLLERLSFLTMETELLKNLRLEKDFDDGDLRAMTIPVHLIFGTESKLVDVAHRLNETLPRATLDWLPGGHYLPSQRPSELSALIGGYIP